MSFDLPADLGGILENARANLGSAPRPLTATIESLPNLDSDLLAASTSKVQTIRSVRQVLQKLTRQVQDFARVPITETSFGMLRSCQQEILIIMERIILKLLPEVSESPLEMKSTLLDVLDTEVADALRKCLSSQEERAQSLRNSLIQLSTDTHVACVEEAKAELIRESSREPIQTHGDEDDDAGILAAFRSQANAARRRSLEEVIQKEKNRTHQLHGFVARHMKELMKNQFDRMSAEVAAVHSQVETAVDAALVDYTERSKHVKSLTSSTDSEIIVKTQFELIRESIDKLHNSVTVFASSEVEELRAVVLGNLRQIERQVSAGLGLLQSVSDDPTRDLSNNISGRNASEATSARSGDAAAGSLRTCVIPPESETEPLPTWEEEVSAQKIAAAFDLHETRGRTAGKRASSPANRVNSRGRTNEQHLSMKRTPSGSPREQRRNLTNASNRREKAADGTPSRTPSPPARKPSPPASGNRRRQENRSNQRPWRGGGSFRVEPARSRESSPEASSCGDSDDRQNSKATPKRAHRVMRDAHPYPRNSPQSTPPARPPQSTPNRKLGRRNETESGNASRATADKYYTRSAQKDQPWSSRSPSPDFRHREVEHRKLPDVQDMEDDLFPNPSGGRSPLGSGFGMQDPESIQSQRGSAAPSIPSTPAAATRVSRIGEHPTVPFVAPPASNTARSQSWQHSQVHPSHQMSNPVVLSSSSKALVGSASVPRLVPSPTLAPRLVTVGSLSVSPGSKEDLLSHSNGRMPASPKVSGQPRFRPSPREGLIGRAPPRTNQISHQIPHTQHLFLKRMASSPGQLGLGTATSSTTPGTPHNCSSSLDGQPRTRILSPGHTSSFIGPPKS